MPAGHWEGVASDALVGMLVEVAPGAIGTAVLSRSIQSELKWSLMAGAVPGGMSGAIEMDRMGRGCEDEDKEKADELDRGFKTNGILQTTRQERQLQKQDKKIASQKRRVISE